MISVAFLVTCFLMVAMPGPTFALLVDQSMRHGRRAGIATVSGNTTGLVFWAIASAFGLTALVRTSELAFVVLKVAGAVYLCWLGLRTLIRSRSTSVGEPVEVRSGGGLLASYRAGVLTNIANPKAAVLYLALLPQFLPAHGNPAADTALLAAVQMTISVSWYTLVVLAIGFTRRLLSRPVVKARLEQLTGMVLVGLGLRMVMLSRAAV